MSSRLLTQAEVAERLRCSVAKVKKLRLSGRLRYVHGRPMTIPEDELEAYIERSLVVHVPTRQTPPKKTDAELRADAREWITRNMARRRLRGLK